MEQQRQGNGVISGSGQLGGGMYRDITISGSGNVNGDVNALEVKVSGSAQFRGNVSSESVKVSGSAKFKGHIDTGDCRFSGSGTVDGHLHARTISTSGSLSCKEDVRAEEIIINGSLQARGDVEAESFEASGGFNIKGLLNASTVKVNMHGKSFVQEIGGDRITVRINPLNFISRLIANLFNSFGYGHGWGLQSELIEATDVSLEWSAVGVVRGNCVRIGPGCNIGLVEYAESVYIDPKANVRDVRQIVK